MYKTYRFNLKKRNNDADVIAPETSKDLLLKYCEYAINIYPEINSVKENGKSKNTISHAICYVMFKVKDDNASEFITEVEKLKIKEIETADKMPTAYLKKEYTLALSSFTAEVKNAI